MKTPNKGILSVYAGPMFSQKTSTSELLYKKFKQANVSVTYLKPDRDNRYCNECGQDNISTNEKKIIAQATIFNSNQPERIFEVGKECDVIIIEEVQFVDERAVEYIQKLVLLGKEVIAIGLDMNVFGMPFITTAKLLAICESPHKLTAICDFCKLDKAILTFLKEDLEKKREFREITRNGESFVLIGGKEKFGSICTDCEAKHKLVFFDWKKGAT